MSFAHRDVDTTFTTHRSQSLVGVVINQLRDHCRNSENPKLVMCSVIIHVRAHLTTLKNVTRGDLNVKSNCLIYWQSIIPTWKSCRQTKHEVDISIPELSLGIEWNGIVHFKPIYGESKFKKILKRDKEKQEIAKRKDINLIVIPDLVSTKVRVKEAFVEICQIIDKLPPLDSNQQPTR